MIYLRSYRVIKTSTGAMRMYPAKDRIGKWSNDHVFDFDILKPEEWKKFISKQKTTTNKLLPHISKDGELIVYEVYYWGVPNYIKEYFGKLGVQDGYVNLFPGYDKEGKKKDLIKYGRLR